MVVSKRCKLCTQLDADNFPIAGEYFGKILPSLIERLCGVELDERKANGVLICKHCAIELILTDTVIDKLRNAVQRLGKTAKVTKPKTPAKDPPNKKAATKLKTVKDVNETPTKDNGIDEHDNDKTNKVVVEKVPMDLNDTPTKANGIDVNDSKTKKGLFGKTGANAKFKKIPDSAQSPTKNVIATTDKRKAELLEDCSDNAAEHKTVTPKKRSKTISQSLADQSLFDLTTDEQDLNATEIQTEECNKKPAKIKVQNCVICGKSFNQKSLLRDHIDACHMGERLKECPHCSMEFRSQQKYESHVFNEKCKNTLHACQFPNCNKHFKTVHKMEMHMQDKHSSQNESEND